MVWMEAYFLCCSVRLGVIIISVSSFISILVPSSVLLAMGLTVLNPVLALINEDVHFRKYSTVKTLTNLVDTDSTNLKVVLQLYFFAHMAACVLAFYGALKLKKYFLLPIIFFDFGQVIYSSTFHILLMTVSKNRISLGFLITFTLLGVFVILFLGYNWATCVALYQIINLINSERYKTLYGEDPFNPLIPRTVNSSVKENVRVLFTPTNHDIDEQKKRNTLQRNRALMPQPIISVLPVNTSNFVSNGSNGSANENNVKWKKRQWHTPTARMPPTAERHLPIGGISSLKYHNQSDTFENNYNYWQWSELAPAISFRNKKKIYLD